MARAEKGVRLKVHAPSMSASIDEHRRIRRRCRACPSPRPRGTSPTTRRLARHGPRRHAPRPLDHPGQRDGGGRGGPVRRLLGGIGRCLCRVLGLSRCSIYLTTDVWTFRGLVGFSSSATSSPMCASRVVDVATDPVTAELVRTRAPVVIADARTDARPQASVVRRLSIRDLVALPLVLGDRVIGRRTSTTTAAPTTTHPTPSPPPCRWRGAPSAFARQGQVLLALRRSIDKARAERDMLERTTRGQLSVDAVAIEGGPPSQLVGQVSHALGRPVRLLGRDAASSTSPAPTSSSSVTSVPAGAPVPSGATPRPPPTGPPDPPARPRARAHDVPARRGDRGPTRPDGARGSRPRWPAASMPRRVRAHPAAALIRLAQAAGHDRRRVATRGPIRLRRAPGRRDRRARRSPRRRRVARPPCRREHPRAARPDQRAGRTDPPAVPASGIGVVVRSSEPGSVTPSFAGRSATAHPPDGSRLAVVSRVAATTDAVAVLGGEVDAIATMLEQNRVDRSGRRDPRARSESACARQLHARRRGRHRRRDAAAARGACPRAVDGPPRHGAGPDRHWWLDPRGGTTSRGAREHRPLPPAADPRADAARPLVAGDLFQFQVAMRAAEQPGFPIDLAP